MGCRGSKVAPADETAAPAKPAEDGPKQALQPAPSKAAAAPPAAKVPAPATAAAAAGMDEHAEKLFSKLIQLSAMAYAMFPGTFFSERTWEKLSPSVDVFWFANGRVAKSTDVAAADAGIRCMMLKASAVLKAEVSAPLVVVVFRGTDLGRKYIFAVEP